jgi:hypothetical protein
MWSHVSNPLSPLRGAELVVSLDAVMRLGLRCGLDFCRVYSCLKADAYSSARLEPLVTKGLRFKAKKMERLVAAMAKLCSEIEALKYSTRRRSPSGRWASGVGDSASRSCGTHR